MYGRGGSIADICIYTTEYGVCILIDLGYIGTDLLYYIQYNIRIERLRRIYLSEFKGHKLSPRCHF